ncbi:hypothetical protein AN958_10115, partial [Leucoagaricus sp. SymC.cos]
KDWVTMLPAVEFAINLACSEVTGYTLFSLNNGRMSHSLIQDDSSNKEYPGVKKFALGLKNAIMSAHDSILTYQVKEIQTANWECLILPFDQGDLVYISTKNISMLKGLAQKFVPKFISLYPIIQRFSNNSFRVSISKTL